jgi:hypothetical protein
MHKEKNERLNISASNIIQDDEQVLIQKTISALTHRVLRQLLAAVQRTNILVVVKAAIDDVLGISEHYKGVARS